MNKTKEDKAMKIMKWVAVMLLLMVGTVNMRAQNSIDELVSKYSSVGDSKFTSAVERDPVTGKVQKVVKVLQMAGNPAPFINAFKEESKNGTFSQKRTDDIFSMTLGIKQPKTNRVYMLKYESEDDLRMIKYTDFKVTIIIKYK